VNSAEITTLKKHELVTAEAETVNSQGIVRLRIIKPVKGWISKRRSLVSKVGVCVEDSTGSGESLNTSSELSEEELLCRVEDMLEVSYGEDLYRKDDRFFGNKQGRIFGAHVQDANNLRRIVNNRRTRVMGSATVSSAMAIVAAKPGDEILQMTTKCCQTIATLYCRAALLACLCNASTQRKRTESAARRTLWPLFTAGDDNGTTAEKVAITLCNFFRLVTFRSGYEEEVSLSFERLLFDELTSCQMHITDRTLESFVSVCAFHLLQDSTNYPHGTGALTSVFLANIARNLRGACNPAWGEHSHLDEAFEDDMDEHCVRQSNVSFARYLSRLLLEWCGTRLSTAIVENIFKLWSMGLRAPSLSLKHIVYQVLTEMLTSLSLTHTTAEPFVSASAFLPAGTPSHIVAQILETCVALLPEARLKRLAAMRLAQVRNDYTLR
jgi:hypothetical protein